MKCEIVLKALDAHVDGELIFLKRWAVVKHLKSCERCAKQVAARQSLSTALKRGERVAAPPDFVRKVMDQIIVVGPQSLAKRPTLTLFPRVTRRMAAISISTVTVIAIAASLFFGADVNRPRTISAKQVFENAKAALTVPKKGQFVHRKIVLYEPSSRAAPIVTHESWARVKRVEEPQKYPNTNVFVDRLHETAHDRSGTLVGAGLVDGKRAWSYRANLNELYRETNEKGEVVLEIPYQMFGAPRGKQRPGQMSRDDWADEGLQLLGIERIGGFRTYVLERVSSFEEPRIVKMKGKFKQVLEDARIDRFFVDTNTSQIRREETWRKSDGKMTLLRKEEVLVDELLDKRDVDKELFSFEPPRDARTVESSDDLLREFRGIHLGGEGRFELASTVRKSPTSIYALKDNPSGLGLFDAVAGENGVSLRYFSDHGSMSVYIGKNLPTWVFLGPFMNFPLVERPFEIRTAAISVNGPTGPKKARMEVIAYPKGSLDEVLYDPVKLIRLSLGDIDIILQNYPTISLIEEKEKRFLSEQQLAEAARDLSFLDPNDDARINALIGEMKSTVERVASANSGPEQAQAESDYGLPGRALRLVEHSRFPIFGLGEGVELTLIDLIDHRPSVQALYKDGSGRTLTVFTGIETQRFSSLFEEVLLYARQNDKVAALEHKAEEKADEFVVEGHAERIIEEGVPEHVDKELCVSCHAYVGRSVSGLPSEKELRALKKVREVKILPMGREVAAKLWSGKSGGDLMVLTTALRGVEILLIADGYDRLEAMQIAGYLTPLTRDLIGEQIR